MHVQIAIGATQHRVEPNRHLADVERIAHHLVGARAKARVERRGVVRRDHDGGNDAGVRIALETRERRARIVARATGCRTRRRAAERAARRSSAFRRRESERLVIPRAVEPPLDDIRRSEAIGRIDYRACCGHSLEGLSGEAPKYGCVLVKSNYDRYSTLRAVASVMCDHQLTRAPIAVVAVRVRAALASESWRTRRPCSEYDSLR